MKLTGPFYSWCTLLCRTVWSWLRGLYISFPSEWSVRLSKRKSESYFSADWTFCQLKTNTNIRMVKEQYFFSQLTSSFQMPSREMKEQTCDGTLASAAHSNMWIMRWKEITDHDRAAVSDWFSTREFYKEYQSWA